MVSSIRRRTLTTELLEDRRVLAQLLPDLFAWEGNSENYLHDYRIEGDLLRFSTALANQGDGPLEIRGGAALPSGNQEVYQRIFEDDGSFEDVLAGEFTYHPTHGHIHFDGYAIYNLHADNGGVPGEIVATGGKVSFCLIDITPLPGTTNPSSYGSCGATRQGISEGWSDVYGSGLSDQWINIATIPDGDYFMQVIVDPDDQLIESDESNNKTTIPVTINRGGTSQGDGYESNDSFADSFDLGTVSFFNAPGLSIHVDDDEDFFKFTTAGDGDFTVEALFTHDLGDIDLSIYDSSQQLVIESSTNSDLESVSFPVLQGQSYFIKIDGVDDAVNGYDLELNGPGDLITTSVESDDPSLPIAIGDDPAPGITSTLEGPDVELTDVNLLITNLDHTYVGDLTFTLTSPSGTTAEIIRSANLNPSGFLGGESDFTNTVIDDQSSNFLGDASAPFTGIFNVNHTSVGLNPLAIFNGENALGTWTIEVEDDWGGDTGTLRDWGLQFTGVETPDGDRYEPNNAFPQAVDLGAIGSANEADLSIHLSGDEDFFRFQPENDATATIDALFTHSEGDLELAVYDATLTEIATSTSSTDNENLSISVTQNELYYIVVRGTGGETNESYTLNVNVPTTQAGDFDGNGVVDAADVDHMCSALGNGNVGSEYDLNGDGTIDAADGQYMITDVMGLLLGDADLNGDVDVSDFNAWNANKFTSGACHADGDFNFDGNVDVGDFNLWNTNKFTSAARDSATSPTVVDEEVSLNRTKPAIDISRVTFATVQEEDESDARDRRTSMFDSSSNHEESVDSFYSEF